MHKQLLKFKFVGNVYDNYDYVLLKDFHCNTDAKSAKQALSNINFAAKKKCGLEPNTLVILSGQLYCEDIMYYEIDENRIKNQQQGEDVEKYTHELSTGALKLNKNANLPYYADLFAFFGKDDFSREQFIWKMNQLKSSRPTLRKVSRDEGPQQLSLFDLIPENDDTLKDEEEIIWIWDEEEGVYWKNGVKFGDYLISLEDQ